MRVLVACEFSGTVRDAFYSRGHEAYSCDLEPDLKGSKYHFQCDVIQLLKVTRWDLMIAHPPCTYLSNMSNCRIKQSGRLEKRINAFHFLIALASAAIPKIAIENPRGYPERAWRKADQIIHPFEFGHPQSKATCLWLTNLPLLKATNIVSPEKIWDGKRYRTFVDNVSNWDGNAHKKRSITFQGIANAMAEQWGSL